MAMHATFMAWDFNTPGAIFLFLVLIGLLNVLFKVVARNGFWALGVAAAVLGLYLAYYLSSRRSTCSSRACGLPPFCWPRCCSTRP